MTAVIGTVLGGRYELTERIAAGGMGEVWKATDRVLGRPVAVKVIKPSLGEDDGFAHRFRAEARHAARLSHGNIAQVHDFGEDAQSAYLVMELVPGTSVADLASGRQLSLGQVVDLVGQAAAGLANAHESGIVHRDVKPANMLVTPRGVVKLTDFGIARALGEAKVTRTGEVMGTVQYLPPEAALGREVDAQADVYSLAVVTYELLAGRRPFHADSAVSLALQHVNDPPPPLPEQVPAPVRQVVMRGLAKDSRARPPGTEAFARELRDAAAGRAVSGPSPYLQGPHGGPPLVSAPQSVPMHGPPASAYGAAVPAYGHASPAYGTAVPTAHGWTPAPHGVQRPGPSRASTVIGRCWVGLCLLMLLTLLLPYGSYQGQHWNGFQLSGAEAVYLGHTVGSTDAIGWLLAVNLVGLGAFGLPHALGRPHIAWPILSVFGCLFGTLMWLAAMGVVSSSQHNSPLSIGVGAWFTGLLGTALLGVVIAAIVKRR